MDEYPETPAVESATVDEAVSTGHRKPITVMHWGTYHPEYDNGKLVKFEGVAIDPDPSPIANGLIDGYDHPVRIKQPAIRRGFYENGRSSETRNRGNEPFVAVSWEQAERIVADTLQSIKTQYGNEAIFAGSYGWASAGMFHHAPSQLHRFLNCFGGFTYSVNSYSFAAAEVIVPHVIGNFHQLLVNSTSWPSIIESTDLLVAFGGLPLKNGQIEFRGNACHVQKKYMQQASENGVEFVNISPIRDDTDGSLHADWFSIIPNSDVAMMLAIAHEIVVSNQHDQEFLNTYCVGFEKFRDYLVGDSDGQPKNADWAAGICGIPASEIRRLAHRMASRRTMISVSWSLTRQEHGEHNYWMGIALAAILGQIGLPGGGIGFGYSATNGVGNSVGRVRYRSCPVGTNPVKHFIPVARIADMLLHPGEEFDYNGGRYVYPDIRLVWWAGGNPFHHHQDINRLIKAWQKPECIIVNDPFWTPAARYADIVLPATTMLERTDISASPRDSYIVRMDQILPPFGESRNDHQIFSNIAKRLGIDKEFTESRTENEWHQHLYELSKAQGHSEGIEFPAYESILEKGWHQVQAPKKPRVMLEPFRSDPDQSPLRTPSGKIEIFSETIDSFNYDNCPGHPTWMPPSEWLGKSDRQSDELHLVSNQPTHRLHSQLDHGSHSQSGKINGREPIRIHTKDAEQRNIQNGDTVRVFNRRGAFLATACLEDNMLPGVLQIATGAWFNPLNSSSTLCKHGNPNTVTHDRGTSRLAQGPAALSCLVKIEKYHENILQVTAFKPPEIITNSE